MQQVDQQLDIAIDTPSDQELERRYGSANRRVRRAAEAESRRAERQANRKAKRVKFY